MNRRHNPSQDGPAHRHPAESSTEFLFYVAWTIAFWIEVSKTSSDVCHGSVWFWSNFAKIYYLVVASICLFTLIFCRPAFFERINMAKAVGLALFNLITSLIRLSGIAVFVGMMISFANRDECPDLKTIVTAYFIVSMIAIGIAVLVLFISCLALCFGLMSKDRSSNSAMKSPGKISGFSLSEKGQQIENNVVMAGRQEDNPENNA